MNSKLKGIIICGVFVVCLAVVAIVLTVGGAKDGSPSKEEDSSQSGQDAVEKTETPLVNFDKTQVKKIVVENEFGTLSFLQDKVGGEEWTVEEIKDLEQNHTLTTAAANIVSQMKYLDIAEENASDLAKYGLSTPKSTLTVSYADVNQTEKTFLIGNESPKSGYYYLCEKGQTTVYTVNEKGLRYFMSKPEYFADLTLMEAPANQNDWPDILDLIITRSDWDYQVKFKSVDELESVVSTQIMYEPITMPLNITGSADVTHGLWGLTAEEAVKAFPTDGDKKEYGIDAPFATVELKIEDGTYKLYIGKPIYVSDENGEDTKSVAGYYVYFEGAENKDAIFSVPVDSLAWATFKPEDVMSTIMTSNYIYDVDKIVVEGEKNYTFDLIGEGKDAPTEVECEGKKLDKALFADFYQYVITCPTNEIYFEESDAEPYASVSIQLKDGGEDKLEFVKDTERRTVVYLNGRPQFLIASGWTDTLFDNIESLLAGEALKEFI